MDVAFRFACCVYGISALGIAGTHRQLCIADYKYSQAAGKKKIFKIWLAHQASAQTYLANLCFKKALA